MNILLYYGIRRLAFILCYAYMFTLTLALIKFYSSKAVYSFNNIVSYYYVIILIYSYIVIL